MTPGLKKSLKYAYGFFSGLILCAFLMGIPAAHAAGPSWSKDYIYLEGQILSTIEPGTSSYALAVLKAGGGTGTVTSADGKISCGTTCSASYTSGTQVTLTAAPGANSTFAGWSGGGCSGTGACTVAMNAAMDVTATFNTQSNYRQPDAPANVVNGLNYAYYEGEWYSVPNFDAVAPVATGTAANINIGLRTRNDWFGFRFTGYVEVPQDGEYTFFTYVDDGTKLYIGSTLVVDNGTYSAQEASGKIGLKAGKHAIRLDFFEAAGNEFLNVSYQGPGVAKQRIPDSALFREGTPPPNAVPPQIKAIVDGVTNSTSTPIYTDTTITIWATGLSQGGNTATLKRDGYTDVSLSGLPNFYDGKNGQQINASLDNRVAAGVWTVIIQNASGLSSSATDPAATLTVMARPSYRQPDAPANVVNGLNYAYYEGYWERMPNFDSLAEVKRGTVATFDISPRNRTDGFGFKFAGYVQVPQDGVYRFYTTSDDGSRLYIGNTLVVDNDGLHGAQEASGTIGLKAGKHTIWVVFFEYGGDEWLTVSYEGPGVAKQAIPASALYRESSTAFYDYYDLTVFKAGGGTGTVASTDGKITCGSNCSASYPSSTQVILTASSTSGTFAGWSGGGCSGTGSCTVTMNAAQAVTATFNQAQANYVGCFTDDGNRALPTFLSGSETVESCVQKAAAAGYAFAGLQYYGQCFAGNTAGYVQVADAECSTPCTANTSQICGGPWRNSIYRTSVSSSTDGVSGLFARWKLDETVGTTVADSSGAGRSGSVAGTVSRVAGRIGGAYGFSGGGYVAVNIDLPETNYTFAAWFQSTAARGTILAVVDPVLPNASSHDRHLYLNAGRVCHRVWYEEIYCSAAGYNDGSWHHAAVTVGAGGGKLYIDGQLVATGSKTSSDFNWQTGLVIGDGPQAGALVGTLDDVRIYNRALAASEVNTLYAGGGGGTRYDLSVLKAGGGTGTVASADGKIICGSTCSASYTSGTQLTLTAAPTSGTFAGWSGACSGTGTCTVTMNAAKSVTATFSVPAPTQPQITAIVDGTTNGSAIYIDTTITIFGSGFSVGGNTVQLQRPGYADVWLYKGDGHYYWDDNGAQINASLDNRAAAGTWSVTVRNAQAWPSNPKTFTINGRSVCGNGICESEAGENGSNCGQDCCDQYTNCLQTRQNDGVHYCRNMHYYEWQSQTAYLHGWQWLTASDTTQMCSQPWQAQEGSPYQTQYQCGGYTGKCHSVPGGYY
jgi:hypothetical protein